MCSVFLLSLFQISLEFRNLAEKYQTVIANICQKMGFGMAEFLVNDMISKQDWDKVSVSVK
jgi:farnesyl-diphosphate farnesyltransferase